MGLGRAFRRARSLSLRNWADLATATAELALARVRLGVQDTEHLIDRERAAKAGPVTEEGANDGVIGRVAFAVGAMGARVPWRSNCLVQALAAKRWLARHGIDSRVELGARKAGEALDAHAWLTVGDRVVVGGDVKGYAPFPPVSRNGQRPR